MTRIYFTPTKPKPHIPLTKGGGAAVSLQKRNHNKDADAHVKHHNNSTNHNNSNPNPNNNTSNSNHNNSNNLDPSAIEQIADGLEKMVRSWSHPHQYVVSNHFRCTDLIIENSGNSNGVVIDGDGGDGGDRDAVNRYAGQEGSASLISSDTIKSATMELHEDGEFSIDTKETTISYIHQRDPNHQAHNLHNVHRNHHHHIHNPHHHPQQQHFQQTRIVDVIDENEGFLHEVLGEGGGENVENRLLSIQNGQSCEAMDSYPSMGNGIWYLNPPLMTPNTTICSGKEHQNCDTHQASMCDDDGDANNGRADLQRQNIKVGSGCLLQEKRKMKPEKLSCKLEVGDTNTWSETVEINGGNKIKELLGKKLTTSSNDVGSIQGTNAPDLEYYKKKVEELQIALLECAMEYEVKIVEMKMEALQTKSHEQRIEPSKEKDAENSRKGNRHEAQRVEYLKKQLSRLQHEKAVSARELSDLRKRERQFDLQRRSLDDALCRVNFLQSELAKKEQDILDCRLREKEAKAQLYELQLGLQKAQAAQIEPRKLLTLLPALKDWIHSTKKGPDNPHDHNPPIDNIVYAITKEIQMLQSALSHISNRA